ncbi:MAG: hypothetical protein QF886_07560, partial [Planctomycetota bacterium]|nr:hypothetical protein [Planctomycetota bacterium]
MLDKKAIAILIATFLFLAVYQRYIYPTLYPTPPPPPPGQIDTDPPEKDPEDPKPNKGGEVTPKGPGDGDTGGADNTGGAIVKEPNGETEPPEKNGDTEHPDVEPPKVPKSPKPPKPAIKQQEFVLPRATDRKDIRFRAVFTNLGAALKRLELLDYPISAANPASLPLVMELEPGVHSLVLEELQNRDSKVKLSEVHYETEDYDPDAKEPKLVFSTSLPGRAIRIRKTFWLEPEKRHLNVRLELTSSSDEEEPLNLQLGSAAGIFPEPIICDRRPPKDIKDDLYSYA